MTAKAVMLWFPQVQLFFLLLTIRPWIKWPGFLPGLNGNLRLPYLLIRGCTCIHISQYHLRSIKGCYYSYNHRQEHQHQLDIDSTPITLLSGKVGRNPEKRLRDICNE